MSKIANKLTVFFEEPFWIGIFEKIEDGKLSVAKITFGSEPKDNEVYAYILKNYYQLSFSSIVTIDVKDRPKNPKRKYRKVQKELKNTGVGTKSQQALKMQQEQMKTKRKQLRRKQREAEKKHLFELKQQKKKQKHRGR